MTDAAVSKSKSERQQFWLDHIKAAVASRGTMAQYAAAHDLKVGSLYEWRRKLRRQGLLPGRPRSKVFVPVSASTTRSGCLVTLRNGVQVQIVADVEAALLERVLAAANALP